MTNTTTTKLISLGVLLAVAIIFTFMGIRLVDAGEVGVVTRWGKVTGRLLEPGAHIVVPVADEVYKYDTKKIIYETRQDPEKYDKVYDEEKGSYLDFPVDTNTKDGQQVNIFFTIRFSVDPSKATWVAQNIGKEDALVGKIVKTEARIWARNIPREFEAAQLYSASTQIVQNQIADKLRPVFAENGVLLDEVGVREIQFTKNYTDAIEAKQIAAVQVETEKNKADQAEFEKVRRITQAEAAAQEQQLQRETLTDNLLQKMLLEKWDGKYPETLVTGDTGQFILPLPNVSQ